jgi:hypothetical protein
VASFTFIGFTASRCSENDSFNGDTNARKSITAEADSAESHAASGTIAAEPIPGSTGGKVRILFRRRK